MLQNHDLECINLGFSPVNTLTNPSNDVGNFTFELIFDNWRKSLIDDCVVLPLKNAAKYAAASSSSVIFSFLSKSFNWSSNFSLSSSLESNELFTLSFISSFASFEFDESLTELSNWFEVRLLNSSCSFSSLDKFWVWVVSAWKVVSDWYWDEKFVWI